MKNSFTILVFMFIIITSCNKNPIILDEGIYIIKNNIVHQKFNSKNGVIKLKIGELSPVKNNQMYLALVEQGLNKLIKTDTYFKKNEIGYQVFSNYEYMGYLYCIDNNEYKYIKKTFNIYN